MPRFAKHTIPLSANGHVTAMARHLGNLKRLCRSTFALRGTTTTN